MIDLFTRVGASLLLLVGGGLWLFAGGQSSTPHASLTSSDEVIVSGGQTPTINPLTAPGLADTSGALAYTPVAEPPASGSCDVLDPDQGFVDEMLVRFAKDGSMSYERRVALVIGNGEYQGAIGRLDNPANDATSMANVMSTLGFTVFRGIDLDADGLEKCLSRFTTELKSKPTDIALFFYAGHGIQLVSEKDNEKRNYMMATDARIAASGEGVGYKQIDAVLNQMRDQSEQSVFFYDACRNYPLGDQKPEIIDGVAIKRGIGLLSGAAAVNLKQQEADERAGIYIAYATAPNRVADDAYERGADHSPFTKALLNNIATPGYSLKQAMSHVSNDVGELTDWNQAPWTSSSLTTELRFNGQLDESGTKTQSELFAAEAERLRTKGKRGAAIATALKGISRPWPTDANLKNFSDATVELSRSWSSGDLVLVGHNNGTKYASFSNDGKKLVSTSGGPFGSVGNSVIVWNVDTGNQVRMLGEFERDANSAVYSPDDQYILTTSDDGTARLWDASTGEEIRQLKFKVGENLFQPAFAEFSPKGDRAAIAVGSSVVFWDLKTTEGFFEQLDAEVTLNHESRVLNLSYSPSGILVATATSDSEVAIWDLKTMKQLHSLRGDDGWATSVDFSSDGKLLLSASNEKGAYLWDVDSGKKIGVFEGHKSGLEHASFGADDKYVLTASDDGTVKVWDIATGLEVFEFDGHRGPVNSVRYSPTRRLVLTTSDDGTVRTWRPPVFVPTNTFADKGERVQTGSYSPDGSKLVTSKEEKAIIWDSNSGEIKKAVSTTESAIVATAFAPNGKTILAAGKSITVLDIESGDPLVRFHPPSHDKHNVFTTAVFSSDGKLIAATSTDQTIRVISVETGDEVRTIKYEESRPRFVEFSPDSKTLVSDLYDWAIIWNLETGEKERELYRHRDNVSHAEFSPKGDKIATTSSLGGKTMLWDVGTGAKLFEVQNGDLVKSVRFSKDGRRLFTFSYFLIEIWDAHTGVLILRKTMEEDGVTGGVSPDGSNLVTASTSGVSKTWDIGPYGPDLLEASYALLTPELRAEVERERIRYWEVDPAVLQ